MITAQLVLAKNQAGESKVKQGNEREQVFRFPQWLESQEQDHLYVLGDSVYQISLSPMTVGAKTIGWLAFGFEIDQELAQHFLNITQLHTDFAIKVGQEWRLIASSNADAQLDFTKRVVNGETPNDYIAIGHHVDEAGQLQLALAMYGLRADIVEVLQEQWWQFLILTFITLLLSLAVAYVIAASITKPIKQLVKQAKIVASGDYHQTVQVNDSSELGQLAKEFNAMQSAVLSREKAIIHRANHDPLTDLPNRSVLKLTLQ